MKNSRYEMEKLLIHVSIDTGFPFKSEFFTDNANDIPLVKGENLQQGYIDWNTAKYWPRDRVNNYKKYWLSPDDVVIAMDRPWVQSGLKWSCIKSHDPQAFLVQRVARLRSKGTIHQKFLRCVIGSEYFSGYIQPIVTGVNVPHISAKQIGDFVIPIPSPLVQEKIAAIVATYDDLIENNDRRITLLEKMAEEIYREWFVRLRFPGHEQATFHKGIPEGWEYIELGQLLDIKHGYAFKGEFFSQEPAPNILLTPGNFAIGGGYKNDKLKYYNGPIPENYILKAGDMIVTMTDLSKAGDTLGYPALVPPSDEYQFLHNQRLGKVLIQNEKVIGKYFLYNIFCSELYRYHVVGSATGSTVKHSSPERIKSFQVLLPTQVLMQGFESQIGVIRSQIVILSSNNNLLKQTRDRLLTRLISGKLSVEDLDIQFPPSMTTEPN